MVSTFAVKEPEVKNKLEACILYIILKQSSNIMGECEQIIVADDSAKCTTPLRGLSPRANYTDRAAAAGRRI